ncbi:MAG: hypothetical protein KA059_06650 [Elusimicrobiales bacterium]|nr:hypothetical protein [Elusimicrobiales bacterium]
MTYNIWKDIFFYFYVFLFSASAVVLINSITKFAAVVRSNNKDKKSEYDEFNDEALDEEKAEEPSVISDSDDVMNIFTQEKLSTVEETAEKVQVINEESQENLDSEDETAADKEDLDFKKTLLDLNNTLEEIEKKISYMESNSINVLNNVEKKVSDFDDRINKLSHNNELSEKILNFEKTLKDLESSLNKKNGENIKSTPKYIYKYINDIVDDYDNIDKEMIRKRLNLILNELKDLNTEDDE